MIGYTAMEGYQQHNYPAYFLSPFNYQSLLEETVEQLQTLKPEILDASLQTTLDPMTQVFVWCGMTDKDYQQYHAQCITKVIDKIIRSGVSWYEHGIHKVFYHFMAGHFRLPQNALGFLPYFTIGPDDQLLDMAYESRFLGSPFLKVPARNLPHQTTRQQQLVSASLISSAPKGASLMAFDKTTATWHTAQEITHDSPRLSGLKQNRLYGIQLLGQIFPERLFTIMGSLVLESPELTAISYHRNWQFSRSIDYGPQLYRKPLRNNAMDLVAPVGTLAYELIYLFSPTQWQLWINNLLPNSAAILTGLPPVLATLYENNLAEKKPISNENTRRYAAIYSLVEHYRANTNHAAVNLLFELAEKPKTLLGVMEYNQMAKEYSGKRFVPLQDIELELQIQWFEKAREKCRRRFGSCNPMNKTHLDYLAFNLVICTHGPGRSCSNLWNDAVPVQLWKIFSQAYDTAREPVAFAMTSLPAGTFIFYPSFSYSKKDGYQLFLEIQEQDNTSSKPASSVLLKGQYSCEYSLASCHTLGDYTLVNLRGNPKQSNVVMVCQQNQDACHIINLSENGLLTPLWPTEALWQEDTLFDPVEYCSDIPYDNLRLACISVQDNAEKSDYCQN